MILPVALALVGGLLLTVAIRGLHKSPYEYELQDGAGFSCDAPSPDDALRCDQEIGHLSWHRCDGSEWFGDSWAVSEWADTQESLPVDPEPTMSAAQWDAECDIWFFPVDEDGNYLGAVDAEPEPVEPVETKQGTDIPAVDPPLPPIEKLPTFAGYRLLGAAACIAVPLIATWGMDPTTPATPIAQAAAPTSAPATSPAPAKAWDLHGHEAAVTKDKLKYANPWWLNPVQDSAGRLHWPSEDWGSGYNTVGVCLDVAEFHKAWGCAAQSHEGIVDINHQAKMHGWDSETYYVVNLID